MTDRESQTVERPEWTLAQAIMDDPNHQGHARTLAIEVLRLRELAEVKYELLAAERGFDIAEHLKPRIDKLYMALNARARGDDTDFDGDPAEPWNNLVGTLATALAHWLANARWAVLEHRSAEKMREALRQLEQWDMLALTDDGHGAATADAPWARALIADALVVPEKPEGAVGGNGPETEASER